MTAVEAGSQGIVFGQRLVELLDERELYQTDLARHLNVTKTTVSRYCQGRIPDAATLDRIAAFFEVTVDYLLGRDQDPRRKPAASAGQGQDDELIVIFRGKRQRLSADYQRLLIKMMEAEAEKSD